MKNKLFIALALVGLLLSALACDLPLDLERGGGLSLSPTPSQTEINEETQLPSPSITPTATQESTPTATLSPTPDLPVFVSPEIISIDMFSLERGWAVAEDRNRLLVTEDGGETWLDVTPADLLPLPSDIFSLGLQPFFLDADTAWFSPGTADVGSLFDTDDGGRTWERSDLPFERAGFYFLDIDRGFALEFLGAGAGSHYAALHRTLDGGSTWTEVFSHEPGESKSLPEGGTKNGITFIDLDRGFIGGTLPMEDHFYFYVTNDGGATWSQETDISLPAAFAGSFLDVWQPIFINQTTGFLPVHAVGSGGGNPLLIYQSTDGGSTWDFHGSVPDGQDVKFMNATDGWIAGNAGLFKTLDGGLSWTPVPASAIPGNEDFLKVDFVDGDHGWLLTYRDDGSGSSRKLYRTIDGGDNWALLQP